MIERKLTEIINNSFRRKKIIVILGPRQVGKTTLLESLKVDGKHILNINCDDIDDRISLEEKSSTELRNMIENYDMMFIDEAQRVKNIGLTLKKIGDLHLNTNIVVTGSSSLEMANEINEPATGRLIEYKMFPVSFAELEENNGKREEQRLLQQRMIYGCYPEVITEPAFAKQTLMTLADNYLYKDLLSFRGIKKPEVLQNLVRALALQVGSEVSYNELSNLLRIDKETVDNYIRLLEQCFVVFRIGSYSRNLRNELKKGKKIYFYDNGIRNAVLSNFAPIELRNDTGQLWENLMISERIKRNAYSGSYAQLYFWRTHEQQEIDLIEEEDGMINAFEFKWNAKRTTKAPAIFEKTYPNTSYCTITPDNYWSFCCH